MGACSSKPKTAEFEAVVLNLYNPDALQTETKKKSLEHDLQILAGYADRFEGHTDKEQRVVSLCSIQNRSSVENVNGYAQVAILESERDGVAGKTRIDEACDAYHAIHEPSQVTPSCMKANNDHNTSRFQKEKADTHTISSYTFLEVEGREAVLTTESSVRCQPHQDSFTLEMARVSCHMAKCLEPKDEYDDTQVVSKKESFALNHLMSTIDESSTNLSKLIADTRREPEHAIKQEEEMQGIPAMQLNNVDIVTVAMDQMLEKLASEFERQESLSSYTLGVDHF